jgi:hypothetical protein
MPDLFGSAPKINGHRYGLFNNKPIDDFRWLVGVFRGDGASQVIIKANAVHLATYYSLRFNKQGEPVPLFRNYLFLEFQEYTTINLCRSSSKFIKIISSRDPDSDLIHPVLVRRNAIEESLRLMTQGKFNEDVFIRPFHGRGSIITVTDGSFQNRKVRLEADVTPEMRGTFKVPVSIDGIKATIEVFKLAL